MDIVQSLPARAPLTSCTAALWRAWGCRRAGSTGHNAIQHRAAGTPHVTSIHTSRPATTSSALGQYCIRDLYPTARLGNSPCPGSPPSTRGLFPHPTRPGRRLAPGARFPPVPAEDPRRHAGGQLPLVSLQSAHLAHVCTHARALATTTRVTNASLRTDPWWTRRHGGLWGKQHNALGHL